jgi:hypothetical protein
MQIPARNTGKKQSERMYSAQIGDISGIWRDGTESDWETRLTSITSLVNFGERMGPGPIALVFDSYAAHRTADAKQTAAEE